MSADNWQENYLEDYTREELLSFDLEPEPDIFTIHGESYEETKFGRRLLPFEIGKEYPTRESAEAGLIEVMKWANNAEIKMHKTYEALLKDMLRDYLIEKEKNNEAVN